MHYSPNEVHNTCYHDMKRYLSFKFQESLPISYCSFLSVEHKLVELSLHSSRQYGITGSLLPIKFCIELLHFMLPLPLYGLQ